MSIKPSDPAYLATTDPDDSEYEQQIKKISY